MFPAHRCRRSIRRPGALAAERPRTAPEGCHRLDPTDDSHPTPQHVRAVIDHALAYGWQLDEIGGTFTLSGAGHARELSLPGFVVTDLLQFANRPALVG